MICEMPTSKELLHMHPLENCVTDSRVYSEGVVF